MNLIELYDKNGKVGELINGDKIESVFPVYNGINLTVVNGVDQSEISTLNKTFHSYETLENFLKRTGEQWVELERWGEKIKVKKSEIAAYSHGKSDGKDCVTFRIKGSDSSIVCDESIESFEEKLGIRKEVEK